MHTEISIAMHNSIQMKLYRAAIICVYKELNSTVIRQMATNTHAANIHILSVHQYALIEQSPQCVYCIALSIVISIVLSIVLYSTHLKLL